MNHIDIIKKIERDAATKPDRQLYENMALRAMIQRLCIDMDKYRQPSVGAYIDIEFDHVPMRVFFEHTPEQKASPVAPPFAAYVKVIAVYICGQNVTNLIDARILTAAEQEILEKINGKN
jgi:hypothetical protein